MTTLCLLLVPIALAISLPLTWTLIGAGYRLGQLDQPDDPSTGGRKLHARPIPFTGGVAIFWAVILPTLLILALAWSNWTPGAVQWLADLSTHLPGLRRQTGLALSLIGAAALLHLLGLIDDRLRLGPWAKFIPQLLVTSLLVASTDLRIFTFLETWLGTPGLILSLFLSILWILAITNAMNFLDNMDGLAAGVGAIIAAVFLAANLLGGQWFVAGLSALLLGALLGFLVFNFHPARIFMGDNGSLVLGFFLAVISIRTTYFGPSSPQALVPAGPWYALLTPLVILAVPLYDLVSVVLIRLREGRQPWIGDRRHFSHRLVARGLSERSAVLVIYLATFATALGGIMLRHLAFWQALLVALQTAAVLALLALLEYTTTPTSFTSASALTPHPPSTTPPSPPPTPPPQSP